MAIPTPTVSPGNTNIAAPVLINRELCMGDSLAFLNGNTDYFNILTNTLATSANNLVNLINTLNNNLLSLSNNVNSIQPGVAKAWAYNLADGTIKSAYNIASIQKVNVAPTTGTTGAWKYTFTTAMPTSSYCIVATHSDTYHWPGTTVSTSVAAQTTTDFTLICDAEQNAAATYPHGVDTPIHVAVFSN
jgi:hypothetical protein